MIVHGWLATNAAWRQSASSDALNSIQKSAPNNCDTTSDALIYDYCDIGRGREWTGARLLGVGVGVACVRAGVVVGLCGWWGGSWWWRCLVSCACLDLFVCDCSCSFFPLLSRVCRRSRSYVFFFNIRKTDVNGKTDVHSLPPKSSLQCGDKTSTSRRSSSVGASASSWAASARQQDARTARRWASTDVRRPMSWAW